MYNYHFTMARWLACWANLDGSNHKEIGKPWIWISWQERCPLEPRIWGSISLSWDFTLFLICDFVQTNSLKPTPGYHTLLQHELLILPTHCTEKSMTFRWKKNIFVVFLDTCPHSFQQKSFIKITSAETEMPNCNILKTFFVLEKIFDDKFYKKLFL